MVEQSQANQLAVPLLRSTTLLFRRRRSAPRRDVSRFRKLAAPCLVASLRVFVSDRRASGYTWSKDYNLKKRTLNVICRIIRNGRRWETCIWRVAGRWWPSIYHRFFINFSYGIVLAFMKSDRIPELDGIRGVAIGMVVIYHYFFLPIATRPGSLAAYIQSLGRLTWTGVDLFFVLSGFLIGGILLDARESQSYFRTFYFRRFFRILPLYTLWFVVTCAAIVLIHIPWMHLDRFHWFLSGHLPVYPYAVFLQNFWMAAYNNLGGAPADGTWSLAIEEQFYLTLPAFVYFIRAKYRVPLLVGGVLMAPAIRVLLHFLWPGNRMALFVLMPCRADALLLGVLGAVLLREAGWKDKLEKSRTALYVAIGVFLGGAVLLTRLDNNLTANMDRLSIISAGYTWMACLYLLFILFAVTQPASLIAHFLRWSPLRWLGTMAYGLYLIHAYAWALLSCLILGVPPRITNAAEFVVALAALVLALTISRLSWIHFEKPLVQLGHRYRY